MEKKTRIIGILLWLLLQGVGMYSVQAAEKSMRLTDPSDTLSNEFIRSYPDRFYIRPFITSRSLRMSLLDSSPNRNRLKYRPNNRPYAGVSVYLFDLGVSLSLRLPETITDNAQRFGETKIFDIQANIYAKRIGADLIYQKYEGFYVNNPKDFIQQWNQNNPFPQRRDLALSTLFTNVFYIFNHKRFSFRSAFNQADRQMKSKGSFFLTESFSRIHISSDSSLVPPEASDEFTPIQGFNGGDFYTLAIMPGYAHNFIMKKVYINASVALGLGNQWKNYVLNGVDINEQEAGLVANFRGGFGYNGDRFFSGISSFFQNVSVDVDRLTVKGLSSNIKVFVGYRFEEKGILKKKLF